MVEQNQFQPHKDGDKDVMRKMDGRLKRLLRMSEEEILNKFNDYKVKRKRKLKDIKQMAKSLPKSVSFEDILAIKRIQKIKRSRLLPHPLFGSLIPERIKPGSPKIRAIALFSGNTDDLEAMGIKVYSRIHDIFTIAGTRAQLNELALQSATLSIRLPHPMPSDMEEAGEQAQINMVNDPDGFYAYRGEGVIVGIIDSPLDVTHPAFRNPGTRNTRVLYYWVQDPDDIEQREEGGYSPEDYYLEDTSSRPNFDRLRYGSIYTQEYINNALGLSDGPYGDDADYISCDPVVDELPEMESCEDGGHGTGVAGVAVGNGYIEEDGDWIQGSHIGAAPEATIVHVSNRNIHENNIIDAIRFIFSIADHLNLPAVINVSRGDQCGCHLGYTSLPVAIDEGLDPFVDKERSVVLGAGNCNAKDVFRYGTIHTSETFTWTPRLGDASSEHSLFICSKEPLACRIQVNGERSSLVSPGGIAIEGEDVIADTWGTEETGNGYSAAIECSTESSRIFYPGWLTSLSIRTIEISLISSQDNLPVSVELRNPFEGAEVNYHAWVCPDGNSGSIDGSTRDELTLKDSACSKSALTVGACEKVVPPDTDTSEDITNYSGAGPALEYQFIGAEGHEDWSLAERIKPEIVAIGGVANPFSDEPRNPIVTTDLNRGYNKFVEGTSFSAPLVAGAAALLFEQARELGFSLNQETIKALISRYAKAEERDNRNLFGYGRLRMLGPVSHLAEHREVDIWIRTAEDDFGAEPYIGDCFCGAPEIKVFAVDADGRLRADPSLTLTWGDDYEVQAIVRNLGIEDAINVNVHLKYTKPHVAPNRWEPVQSEQVEVPALGQTTVHFDFQPQADDVGGAEGFETHVCLLVIAEYSDDMPEYPHDGYEGEDHSAWAANITNSNNVALRNVCIQLA